VSTFTATEVDPTGAGDCFDGTFLAAMVKGYGLQEAVIRANAAGSLAVGKRGPMEGNSDPAEIDQVLNEQSVQVEQLEWRQHYA
jgi:fructokinase